MPPKVQVSHGQVSAGPVHAPVIPLIFIISGAYLAWFGIHYWGSDTKWPTDPVKSVLQGKGVPAASGNVTAAQTAAYVEANAAVTNTQSSAPTAPPVTQNQTGDTGVAGGTYSHADLVRLWKLNGGDPGTADIAAAIAQAESSGRSNVTSSNPDGGTNVGLWQLDTKGKGAGYTVTQLQNPDTNAMVAVLTSANGTNWSAWETYASGAYKQYL